GLSMTVEVDLSSTPEQADGNGQDNGARATGPALSTPVYDHDATEIDARIRQIIQDNIGAAGEPGHEGGNSSGAAARNAKETQGAPHPTRWTTGRSGSRTARPPLRPSRPQGVTPPWKAALAP